MKLRRCLGANGPVIQGHNGEGWVSLNRVESHPALPQHSAPFGTDMLDILALNPRGLVEVSAQIADLHPDEPGTQMLPVAPSSFRDFMLFEEHAIDASRGFVKRFMPHLSPIVATVEALTGKPFGKFKPHRLWYQQPIYYMSNHLNFAPCGATIRWPHYTKALDYELELGAVLGRPLKDASPDEALDAIGGFVVLNDFSARDVQKDEMDSGFGPQKAKHFASSMSGIIITADETLPHLDDLNGSVTINGDLKATCSSKGMHFSFGEAIAFASKGEQLHRGELFGSGTMPGGAGIENGSWLAPGDEISLSIKQIGTVTNKISGDAV